MDPPVRMGVVVTSILHESIHGLLYFYLSHFILQFVTIKKPFAASMIQNVSC